MINYILLGISFLVFVLCLVVIKYLFGCKKLEEKDDFSIAIFGFICMALIFLIDFIKYMDNIFHGYIIKYIPLISSYLNYGNFLIGLVLVPLIGICFIAVIMSLWK